MVLRLLIWLMVLTGAVYAGAYVVADLMPAPEKEIIRPVRTDKFGP